MIVLECVDITSDNMLPSFASIAWRVALMQGLHKAVLRWVIHFMCLFLCYCVMVVSTLGQSTRKQTPQLTGKRPKSVGLVFLFFSKLSFTLHISPFIKMRSNALFCVLFFAGFTPENDSFCKTIATLFFDSHSGIVLKYSSGSERSCS